MDQFLGDALFGENPRNHGAVFAGTLKARFDRPMSSAIEVIDVAQNGIVDDQGKGGAGGEVNEGEDQGLEGEEEGEEMNE